MRLLSQWMAQKRAALAVVLAGLATAGRGMSGNYRHSWNRSTALWATDVVAGESPLRMSRPVYSSFDAQC